MHEAIVTMCVIYLYLCLPTTHPLGHGMHAVPRIYRSYSVRLTERTRYPPQGAKDSAEEVL
jgi:hypothetical protein